MCGISCAVALRGHARSKCLDRNQLSETLGKSLENIRHRGPDAKGEWISYDCRVGTFIILTQLSSKHGNQENSALGHNRLAIVDLRPEAQQPFHSSDDHIHAVVNGELYGYKQIRSDLIARGHKFRSECDSEIVIALYREYGISFITHLRGEFALCLYDSEAQFFIAVGDRYGIKPLFYTVWDGRLLVASEAKAFLPFGWQPEWDVQSLRDNGWLCDRRTLFQGVCKILPGHYMTCTSFGEISQHRYWDFEFKDKVRLSFFFRDWTVSNTELARG